jgi:TPR repeat protein
MARSKLAASLLSCAWLVGLQGLAESACAADPAPALATLDAIAPADWLTVSSVTLLERVIAASSKEALDEAAKSDPRAQALVGSGHLFGAGGYAQSAAEAEKLYRLAAGSNVVAQINLGSLLLDGRANGGKPAPEEAARLLDLAATQGHRVAQYNLGLLYVSGLGVAQDFDRAAQLLLRAAQQGLAAAQVQAGWLQADDDRAEPLFRAAADQGDADGLAAMADTLDHRSTLEYLEVVIRSGNDDAGVPCFEAGAVSQAEARACDVHKRKMLAYKAEADSYFAKAFKAFANRAAAGEAYAMRRYGDLQYRGLGESIRAEKAAAFKSYVSAAAAGDDPAKLNLALMHEIGDGVPQNAAEAARLLQELVDKPGGFQSDRGVDGLDQLKLMRAVKEEKGLGVAQNEADAARVYGELGDGLGDAYALTRLARMTELGLGGLAPDREKAIDFYRFAAGAGVEEARAALERLGERAD